MAKDLFQVPQRRNIDLALGLGQNSLGIHVPPVVAAQGGRGFGIIDHVLVVIVNAVIDKGKVGIILQVKTVGVLGESVEFESSLNWAIQDKTCRVTINFPVLYIGRGVPPQIKPASLGDLEPLHVQLRVLGEENPSHQPEISEEGGGPIEEKFALKTAFGQIENCRGRGGTFHVDGPVNFEGGRTLELDPDIGAQMQGRAFGDDDFALDDIRVA